MISQAIAKWFKISPNVLTFVLALQQLLELGVGVVSIHTRLGALLEMAEFVSVDSRCPSSEGDGVSHAMGRVDQLV